MTILIHSVPAESAVEAGNTFRYFRVFEGRVTPEEKLCLLFSRSLYIIMQLTVYWERNTDVKKTSKRVSIALVCTIMITVVVIGVTQTAPAQEEKTVWDKADEMLETGNYEEAVSLYRLVIELNEGHPDLYLAYFNRAHAFISLERFEDAQEDLDSTLELAPKFSDAYKLRGILNLSLGYFEEAKADFDRLIGLTPQDPYAYANRGTALSYLGSFDRALADFNRSIELDDTCAECYFNRAQLLLLMDRERDAQKDLERAGELDPRYRD